LLAALQAKGNRALAKLQEQERKEWQKEGLKVAVQSLCAVLDLVMTPEQQQQLDAMGSQQLEAQEQRLRTKRRW
jgi:hypothetical protein